MRIETISDWIISTPPRLDYTYKIIIDVATGNKYNVKIYQCYGYNAISVKWVLHFPPIMSIKELYKTFNKGSSDNRFDTLEEAMDKADSILNKYNKLKIFL